ncbi:MAG: diadenylate cyclase CdaA [Anaerolineae bacterium]|nr:diadenylate cyclase CdaA [Anaerolineae bacterium]MDW8103122.1 diadenylate cyclase CdaA [Anaerolineae bacterium]
MGEWIEILRNLTWTNLLDIFLVAVVFYALLHLIRGTQAVQLLRGVLVIAVGAMIVSALLPFTALRWLIRNSIPALLVALPVIFQPEIRRALERLGRAGSFLNMASQEAMGGKVLHEIVKAVGSLAEHHYGALIVLEGMTGLQPYAETGVILDAEVSKELLLTIFYPGTALHDGAVIVRGNKILAAGCILPLSSNPSLYRSLGTRHKAAIGITEQSDALAVVVSEESGTISVAYNGRMIRHLDEKRLLRVLQTIYRRPFLPTVKA